MKNVDERVRNLMCERTLPSLLVSFYNHYKGAYFIPKVALIKSCFEQTLAILNQRSGETNGDPIDFLAETHRKSFDGSERLKNIVTELPVTIA